MLVSAIVPIRVFHQRRKIGTSIGALLYFRDVQRATTMAVNFRRTTTFLRLPQQNRRTIFAEHRPSILQLVQGLELIAGECYNASLKSPRCLFYLLDFSFIYFMFRSYCWRTKHARYIPLLAIAIEIFRAIMHHESECVVIGGNRTVIGLTLRMDKEIGDRFRDAFHRDAASNSDLSSSRLSRSHILASSFYDIQDYLSTQFLQIQ